MSFFDDIKASARHKADANGDGRIDIKDVEYALDNAKVAGHILYVWGVATGITAVGALWLLLG